MVTCFHVLCLEVYYRYLPIYVVENLNAPQPEKSKPPEEKEKRKEKEKPGAS
jgi:hypothetical protein